MNMMNIKYLNYNDYVNKVQKLNIDYWNNSYLKRWDYISVVIDILKTLEPNRVLELGSYKINLTNISDNMDLSIDNIDMNNINNINYIRNATNLPYHEISDKYYDVFVSLQVFEHLKDKQCEVFKEVQRISKYAILSFPYKWTNPKDITHYNLDETVFSKWTNYKHPIDIKYINNRIIYVFKF